MRPVILRITAFGSTVLAVLLGGQGLAYLPALSAAQIQEAYAQAQRLADSPDSGYPLLPYTLYAVTDTLKLEARNGAVDAVTVATPFERTRYQTFLHLIGEDPITATEARKQAGLNDGQIAFIVFAHGMSQEDQTFLKQFSAAKLILNGQGIPAAGKELSGASISQYPRTVGEVGLRFIGTVTYKFNVPNTLKAAKGTLSFVDTSGKAYRLKVDLTRYR